MRARAQCLTVVVMSDRDVRFSAPVVGADGVAVAEFRVLSEEDGAPATLAGCVFARFDAAGLAVETRDYWHTIEGHREPEGADTKRDSGF